MKNHLAVFALIMLVMGSLATSTAPSALADWLIDRSGTLIRVDGAVLGDDDSPDTDEDEVEVEDEDEDEDESNDEDFLSESTARQMEARREAEKQRLETSREALKNQIEVRKTLQEKSGQRSKFELRTEAGKIKLKQEIRDASGRLIRKTESNLEDDSLHIEQEDGETVEVNSVDNRLEIVRNRIKATSNLELKVGEKNEISVTLPNGKSKEISIPDQALERLIANGVITPTGDDSASYELTAGTNGEPVYLADGILEKRFLGIPFLKLKFAQKLEVAAAGSDDGIVQAGDIVSAESQETSPWRRFLESLTR